jgi:hypothetical protein
MGLFQKYDLPVSKNTISPGIILIPSVLNSSAEAQYTPAKKSPSIGAADRQTVATDNTPAKIPGKDINFVENYKNWCVSPVLNNIYKR